MKIIKPSPLNKTLCQRMLQVLAYNNNAYKELPQKPNPNKGCNLECEGGKT